MKVAFLGIVVIVIIGLAGGAFLTYQASSGTTAECPPVKETGKTAQEIGSVIDGKGTVQITNGDATSVGKGYIGQAVEDLRVCFDAKGGHASGKLGAGPISVPFYVTASSVDLSGASPVIKELDFQLGGLPDVAASAAKSTITDLINNALANIKLKKKYSYQFGDGAVTVKAE